MRKTSINLPLNHRLDINLVKPRGAEADKSLFSLIKTLRSVRSGNKISRFFRHIFEHANIRKILGSQFAIIIAASTLLPPSTKAEDKIEAEQAVINVQDTPLITERTIAFPVENPIVNQGYHFFHPGIDLEGDLGDPINPIMKGRVAEIQYSKIAYGNAILIEHDNGLSSLYAHLSKILVQENEEVATYTIIGEVGSTGRSTGTHLHLEVRKNGYPINPLTILPIN